VQSATELGAAATARPIAKTGLDLPSLVSPTRSNRSPLLHSHLRRLGPMQRLTRSATKRAAAASAAGAEPTAQRPRHEEEKTPAAAAHDVRIQHTPQSPAQRCAADTLTAVFSFLPFLQLPGAVRACRACRAWHAAKVQSEEITLHRESELPRMCASGRSAPSGDKAFVL
jgi:hypothetical protein